jgi:predicted MFS family arabinose efflux permease
MTSVADARAASAAYRQPKAVLIAACWLSAAGALLFNVMPAFFASAGSRYALSDEQIGWVGSSYGAGFALVAVTSFVWIARFNWRRVATLGTVLSAISFAACALGPRYVGLLGGMLAAGLGCGALYTVGTAVVAENHEPDRAFGVKLAVETFVGVAMLIALPSLFAERWGFQGVAMAIAGVAGLCGLLALHRTPSGREAGIPTGDGKGLRAAAVAAGQRWLSWLGLGGLLVSFGGIAALWAFLARIAPTFGLSSKVTAQMVLATLIANAFSGVAAALIGDRWGRLLPLTIAMLLALVGVLVLAFGHDVLAYAAGALLTYGMLSTPLSYQMGLIASADATGRVASLIPAALSVGGAIAPAVAGSLLTGASYAPLYAFTAGTILASLAAFLLLGRELVRRRS